MDKPLAHHRVSSSIAMGSLAQMVHTKVSAHNAMIYNMARESMFFNAHVFDSNKQLQAVSTMQDAQTCSAIAASDAGALVCSSSGSLRGKKGGKRGLDAATQAPTPHFLETASPTVGNGPVVVDFVFNCAAGTCPDGEYQKFCPRCDVNTDSTTPGNDPQDSISCLCFNYNGQMLLRTSTMWGFDNCPAITTDFGGVLQCPGATRSSGITVYGGR